MRVGKWFDEDAEVLHPFELEAEWAHRFAQMKKDGQAPRGGETPGGGGARLMKVMLGGTILLILLAGILGIADAIGK